MSVQQEKSCFHCLSPIPDNTAVNGEINGKTESFCCSGCLGVCQWINEEGLDRYYQVRTSAPKADNLRLAQYASFDLPEIYQKYTSVDTAGNRQIDLGVEGIHCAACMWLIEKSLEKQPGVKVAEGNASTFTLHLVWDDEQSKLSKLLVAIAMLGYQPHLSRDTDQQARYDAMRRKSLKRLAFSGLGMMQVMMYSVALYVGAWQGMSPTMTAFFQWVSFFLTTPIFIYSGFPFIHSAIQAVRAKHLNMDVPVAVAITLAYCFSVYHLLKGQGEVFFDSVVMFIFFLSASRYLEMMGRYKALIRTAKNTATLPEVVSVADSKSLSASLTPTPIDSVQVNDLLLVAAGESIAVDGTVILGQSTVNEALLTGESHPISKSPQDKVLAGSINQEQTLLIQTDAVGQQTTLSETKRLLASAQTQKPSIQKVTDRLAGYIVAFILLSTASSFAVWQWVIHADNAFEIALSVLVATCPCALSLAVPTAYAAASNVLAYQRLFIKNNAVIDIIPRLSKLLFDKTGTLTTEDIQITDTQTYADYSVSRVLTLAAVLERHIHHPIAKAFSAHDTANDLLTNQQIISGQGVQGEINGISYLLGKATLISQACQLSLSDEGVYLCQGKAPNARLIARFSLSDKLSVYASKAIKKLQQNQLPIAIVSGDSLPRVQRIADILGITSYRAEQLPADKLNWVKSLQQQQLQVMMIGDGINDAPVLAAADVSLAVRGASALSQSQADIVLLNNDLRKIPTLFRIAGATRRIIRQNLSWAIAYNLLAVPVAILGYLPPWVAALGMSISSLVVLGNALRIYWIK